jgi:hypothetical protein
LIEVTDAAGIQRNDRQVVALVGRYAVIGTGRHKVIVQHADGSTSATDQVVRVVLDDQAFVDLGVRPDAETSMLSGKRVVATGRLVAPVNREGPGARPDPTHWLVDIESVVER